MLRRLCNRDVGTLSRMDETSGLQVWPPAMWQEALSPPYEAWVEAECGRIRGYIVARLVAGEAELIKIAVASEHRRRGVGSRLFAALFTHLLAEGIKYCHLEVRAGNSEAVAFYRGHDFAVSGRRAAYYPSATGREDAVLMRREIRL